MPRSRLFFRKEQGTFVEIELLLVFCPAEETADVIPRPLVSAVDGQGVLDDEDCLLGEIFGEGLESPGSLFVHVEKGEKLRIHGSGKTVPDHLGEPVFGAGGQPELTRPDPEVAQGPAAGLLGEDEFAGRREGKVRQFLPGALGGYVDFPYRFDLIPREQQPVGSRCCRRIDVNHVSPDAEIAAFLDERDPAISALGERCGEIVPVDPVPDRYRGAEAGHHSARHDLLQHCCPGDDHDGRFFFDECREAADPLPFRVFLRREGVREHEVPGGHEQDVIAAGKEGCVLQERPCLFGARAKNCDGPTGQFKQGGDKKSLR